MILIPAIDLLDGRCVRLLQGNFNEVTYYDSEPATLAAHYLEHGSQWLHVVDLAASRDGEAADTQPLFDLLKAADQSVQTGGGVRNGGDIQARLDAGARRVVVGTLSATEPERFVAWLNRFGPDRLVAALDVRLDDEGTPWPRTHGWTEAAQHNLWTLLDQLVTGGLQHVLVTDISRDGEMQGPNVALYESIIARHPGLQVQASGGVSRLKDLSTLKAAGATGCIVGKALLEKTFTVAEALKALK